MTRASSRWSRSSPAACAKRCSARFCCGASPRISADRAWASRSTSAGIRRGPPDAGVRRGRRHRPARLRVGPDVPAARSAVGPIVSHAAYNGTQVLQLLLSAQCPAVGTVGIRTVGHCERRRVLTARPGAQPLHPFGDDRFVTLGGDPLARQPRHLGIVQRAACPVQLGLMPAHVALDVFLARIGRSREPVLQVLGDAQVVARPLHECGLVEPGHAQSRRDVLLGPEARPHRRRPPVESLPDPAPAARTVPPPQGSPAGRSGRRVSPPSRQPALPCRDQSETHRGAHVRQGDHPAFDGREDAIEQVLPAAGRRRGSTRRTRARPRRRGASGHQNACPRLTKSAVGRSSPAVRQRAGDPA